MFEVILEYIDTDGAAINIPLTAAATYNGAEWVANELERLITYADIEIIIRKERDDK